MEWHKLDTALAGHGAFSTLQPGHGLGRRSPAHRDGRRLFDLGFPDRHLGVDRNQLGARHPRSHPKGGQIESMAYDPVRQLDVYYGGYAGSYQSGTWEFSNTWALSSSANSPGIQWANGLAFDARSGRLALLGGYNGSAISSGLWFFTGSSWTAGPNIVTPRYSMAFVYDSVRQKLVVFGGYSGSSYLSDTWEY